MKCRAALLLLLAGCGSASPRSVPASAVDLDGRPQQPLSVADGELHVLLFVTTDCPIANSYAPEIAAMARDWAALPVRLYLVHVDPDVDRQAALQHARAYELPRPILLDPAHQLVQACGITTTPEAVVFDHRGLQYRGRIDDAWTELGASTTPAQHRELQEAVAALLAGRPVPVPRTEPVGCLLPEPRR